MDFLSRERSRLFRSETTCKLIVSLRSSLSTDLFVWQVSKKLEDIRTRYAFQQHKDQDKKMAHLVARHEDVLDVSFALHSAPQVLRKTYKVAFHRLWKNIARTSCCRLRTIETFFFFLSRTVDIRRLGMNIEPFVTGRL